MSTIKDNKYIWIAFWMWLSFLTPAKAASGEIDVQDIVFSHIQDAYTWHITEWNGQEIAIPLPILVKSEERGWDLFLSSHLHQGRTHHNYYIAGEGEHAGKVVEKNSAGEEVRPMDFSLTKNVCGLFLSCGLLLFIVLRTAHWYKKHPNEAPGGFIGLMEMAISYIQDGVIKEAIGKEYKPFSSYLLTVFFFILINNLIGIIPIFPGGANITGNIAVTGVLALCTFIAVNLFATKAYWKEIFWPKAPIYLKLPLPIMPFVEFFGVFTKPSVRQHHGGPYDYLGANLFDIHNGNHGSSREFRYDDRIRLVLCVHELSGIVSSLLASLYFHPAVGQLYRIGQGKGINPKKLRY